MIVRGRKNLYVWKNRDFYDVADRKLRKEENVMKTGRGQEDIAGKEYWDSVWKRAHIPQIINPQDKSPRNVVYRAMDDFYHQTFAKCVPETEGKEFLEVGCGNSAFIPYMNKEFGFRVSGLDYSEMGCEMARKTTEYYGVKADVFQCDLFKPAENLIGRFDIVYAHGVIEHFTETHRPCSAMAELAKPGG